MRIDLITTAAVLLVFIGGGGARGADVADVRKRLPGRDDADSERRRLHQR